MLSTRRKSVKDTPAASEAGARAQVLARAILNLPYFQQARRYGGGRGERMAAARCLGVSPQTFSTYYYGKAGMSPAAERLCEAWMTHRMRPDDIPARGILDRLQRSRWHELGEMTRRAVLADTQWRFDSPEDYAQAIKGWSTIGDIDPVEKNER